MRTKILFLVLFFTTGSAFSQTDFQLILRDGDKARNRGEYFDALKIYDAAEAYDPSQKELVSKKRDSLFNKIASLNSAVGNSKIQIKKLLDTIQYQKQAIQAALDKAEKFIDALSLKEGGLALAYNNEGRVGYINKNGDLIIKYLYRTAGAFDQTGFAKVQRMEEFAIPNTMPQRTEYRPVDYMIAGDGTEYHSAYRLDDLKTDEEQKDEIHPDTILALDLRNTLLNSFPPKILDQHALQILIIEPPLKFENTINKIPKEIKNFKDLYFLSIKKSNIDSLPDEISELKELEYLNFRDNQLKKLPATIGQLNELKFLDLKNNNLESLPEEIGQLKKLEALYLYNNPITKLPSGFIELASLKRLTFGNTSLPELPAILTRLTTLQELVTSDMGLTYFPPEILQLKNLEILDLSENLVNMLPVGLSKLTRLKELDLHTCGLKELQTDFTKLQALKDLNLSRNDFTGFPKQILQLTNLETLDLSFNPFITSIPKEISNLKNLRTLKLNNTAIPTADRKNIQALLPKCNIIFMQKSN